ncbi:MAG: hypothetical protein V2J07_01485 [Anaerolineae bacterium]|jgi:WD40 repeat protein|nr:hypothetical protein [Anaerolineae bacterium]
MKRRTLTVVMLLLLSLCACKTEETPVVAPSPSETAVPEPTSTNPPPEPEPQELPTATSTDELPEDNEPEEAADPLPDEVLPSREEPLEINYLEEDGEMKTTGPWLMFKTLIGLMAVNYDGSEIASFGFPVNDRIIEWDVASQGGVVAMVKDSFESTADNSQKWLEIRALPRNQRLYELKMLEFDGAPLSFTNQQDELDFALDRIRAVGQLAWAHDSLTLAFVSSHEGPSPDVYSYFLQSGEVIQLTDGPSHAVGLAWSPDDAYIFHAGVEKMYTGYSGAGYSGWTFYAAAPDGSEVLTVTRGTDEIQKEEIIGWVSDTEVLMTSGYWFCGDFDLRVVNIEDGAQTMIMQAQHSYSAYDPVSQKALVWVSPDSVDTEECGPASEPGLYLVSVPGGEVEKLEGYPEDETIYGVEWDPNTGLFLVNGSNYWQLVDPEEGVLEQSRRPTFSPDGRWVAYQDQDGAGFTLFDAENDRWVEVSDTGRVLHPSFSPDSSHLFYFHEQSKEGWFSLYVIDLSNLTTSLVTEDIVSEYSDPPVWLMP